MDWALSILSYLTQPVALRALGLTIALLPARQRDRDANKPSIVDRHTRSANARQEQLDEEAEAIASEYQRRCDEAWREELSEKAASMLKSKQAANTRSTKS